MIRFLLIGLVMVPTGIDVALSGLGDKPIYPVGLYTGPAISILGIILILIVGRNFLRDRNRPKGEITTEK